MNYLSEAVHAARSLAFPAVSTSVITSIRARERESAFRAFRNEIIPGRRRICVHGDRRPARTQDLFPNYEGTGGRRGRPVRPDTKGCNRKDLRNRGSLQQRIFAISTLGLFFDRVQRFGNSLLFRVLCFDEMCFQKGMVERTSLWIISWVDWWARVFVTVPRFGLESYIRSGMLLEEANLGKRWCVLKQNRKGSSPHFCDFVLKSFLTQKILHKNRGVIIS